MIEQVFLEPQKDFPLTDISADNTAILEVLLADTSMRETSHQIAERTSPLYKLSHRVLRELVPAIPGMNPSDAHYFDQGVLQYEAAANLIRLDTPEQAEHLGNIDVAGYVMYLLHNDDHSKYFDRAHSRLLNDQERFSEVLTSVAAHTGQNDRRAVENILYGAAVQRQIEIDALRHAEEKFRRDLFGDTNA